MTAASFKANCSVLYLYPNFLRQSHGHLCADGGTWIQLNEGLYFDLTLSLLKWTKVANQKCGIFAGVAKRGQKYMSIFYHSPLPKELSTYQKYSNILALDVCWKLKSTEHTCMI